jgi:hypothetical protein
VQTHENLFLIRKPPRRWLFWLKRLGKILLLAFVVLAIRQAWHHHEVTKKLDEALAEMDRAELGWRLNEIEAAREQVPEDENSARVVVAANQLLPRQWPLPEFDERFNHLAPQEQLAPEDFIELKKVLELVQPALEEARKLASMPRGRHRISYKRPAFDTLLKDQAEGRRVNRLLVLDVLRFDQEKDLKRAMLLCRAVLNSARALGDEPMAVSQLVRTAGVVAACWAAERALAQGEPPVEEMIAFRQLLDREDAFPDLIITARGERACDQETFDALESGDAPISSLADRKQPDLKERIFGFIFRDRIRDERPTMLAMMNRWVSIANLPSHEQAEAEQQFHQEVRNLPDTAILTRLLLPALTRLGEASRRKHAFSRCTIIALASERYRRDHGGWPESIDKLCPKYLDTVPLDPFDGQPLRYRRLADGVVIYSVGQDGIDDGGNLDREHMTQSGVDIGIRLWDVAHRRQSPRPKEQQPPQVPRMQGQIPNPG